MRSPQGSKKLRLVEKKPTIEDLKTKFNRPR
jgi:hypothetical protein